MTTLVRVRTPRMSVMVARRRFAYAIATGKPGEGIDGRGWFVQAWFYDALCPSEFHPPADIAPRVVGVAQCRDGFWWVVETRKVRR